MHTAAELAGFLAAHAVWCVSDGSMLTPMLGYTTDEGKRNMDRLAHDDLAAAVQQGRERLASNEMEANDAVLLYDGRITWESEKLDAILVEMRSYFSPDSAVTLAIPYSPKTAEPFRVYKPKLVQWDGCEDFDKTGVVNSFWSGVDQHEQGAKIWNAALDQSK